MSALSHEEKTTRIRELNDAFRRNFAAGHVMLTDGVQMLSENDKWLVLDRVRHFNQFTADNDPYNEHDFGSFVSRGRKFFWKIDFYDAAMEYGSEDPSDHSQTTRVMTVMLASEY